jgi:CBS domain-containing protein
MNDLLSAVLSGKTKGVRRIGANATVAEAVHLMVENQIGAVLVTEADSVVGMFTERDAVSQVLERGLTPTLTRVREVMTLKPAVASPEMGVEQAMALMTERRLHHLLVVKDGRIVGLVSRGDLTKWLVRENEQLVNYVAGRYPA